MSAKTSSVWNCVLIDDQQFQRDRTDNLARKSGGSCTRSQGFTDEIVWPPVTHSEVPIPIANNKKKRSRFMMWNQMFAILAPNAPVHEVRVNDRQIGSEGNNCRCFR